MDQLAPSAPRLKPLFLTCLGVFATTAVLALIGSGGGPDAQIFFGYVAFLLLLFISAPLHLFALCALVYWCRKYPVRNRYFWFFVYLAAYLAIHLAVLAPVFYEPLKQSSGELLHEMTHQADVALIEELRFRPDPQKVRALVRKGADVNAPDRSIGFTPLMWAARDGNPQVLEILLEAGAAPAAVLNKEGSLGFDNTATVSSVTALSMAAWAREGDRRHASIELLLGRDVPPDAGALLGMCYFGEIELLEAMLADGVDLASATDVKGSTCLHQAVLGDQVPMVEYLIDKGVQLDARTRHTLTPLDTAVKGWKAGPMLRLMQAGQRSERPADLRNFLARAPDTEEKSAIEEILAADTR